MILFAYQGVNYQADQRFYDESLVQLPNGVVLQVDEWDETMPPQPADLTPIDANFAEGYAPPLAEVIKEG